MQLITSLSQLVGACTFMLRLQEGCDTAHGEHVQKHIKIPYGEVHYIFLRR